MPELVREWPRMLQRVLNEIRPVGERTDCYAAEVDLSEDELRALNLFEASARHEHICFKDPRTSEDCVAYLHTPVGLGRPLDGNGTVGRVRITLSSVQCTRPTEARSDHRPEA